MFWRLVFAGREEVLPSPEEFFVVTTAAGTMITIRSNSTRTPMQIFRFRFLCLL